jgi:hypothetical protein
MLEAVLGILYLVALLGPPVIDQISGSIGRTGNKQLLDDLNKVSNKLNSDSNLKQQFMDAYTQKRYDIANSIMMASPVGSAYKKLQKAKKDLIETYKKALPQFDKQINKSSNVLNEVQQEQQARTQPSIGKMIKMKGDLSKVHGDVNSLINSDDNSTIPKTDGESADVNSLITSNSLQGGKSNEK